MECAYTNVPCVSRPEAPRRCRNGTRRPRAAGWLLQHRVRVQAQAFWGSRSEGLDVSCSKPEDESLYSLALHLARGENYQGARDAFEVLLLQYPHMCKAWVSYAQVERRLGRISDPNRFEAARQVLQRGLQLNPGSACLAQAWGLMELQRGNWWAAVRLLERCVVMDPANSPVLRWHPVASARKTVGSRTSHSRQMSSPLGSTSSM